jgi:hypothetical protein
MGLFSKILGGGQPAPNLPVHPDDKELITEYDIHYWESLTLDDFKAFQKQDIFFQFALFKKLVEEDGLSNEEAVKQVRKIHPFYYTTLEEREDEPLGFREDDAKLPYILNGRVNKAVIKYIRKMDKSEIASTSSMNAILRNIIRTGKV